MRAIWNGAVSFGLVNVPVRLYAATSNHDIRFHQVHEVDGGRIRQKRTCSVCGEEVAYSEIAKGYETDDGQLIMLTDDDLASLPTATGHEIDVVQFVPAEQVDPLLLDKSYYLEPENKALKPYSLLREALRETDRMALVKVALRQRETLALLRVRDNAIVLQTMLWPDEVRDADFPVLENDVEVRPQEMAMASSLIDSLSGEFEVGEFEDDYRKAVGELIEYKREHGGGRPAPEETAAEDTDDMTDLLTALRRSVEAAGGKASDGKASDSKASEEKTSDEAPPEPAGDAEAPAEETASGSAGSSTRKKSSSSKSGKAPAEKGSSGTKKTGTSGSSSRSRRKKADDESDEKASRTA
ncbi:Ku protein [Actinomycetospora sp. TBRC 11914]|uniref:non-homologous end joining protein Ku n=1 Tax=Actinomycetospora sp. TBRC 11914 TaxID=2729387 RepID=UPI00145F765F|nr:Ku protein [Actinomycetospora sp. TBRC 11914]NMO92135.1 Ku protein [Actinomycetospora sp. TBRC 11914]